MGLLDTFIVAGLTSSMTSNNIKKDINKITANNKSEESFITISHEKSRILGININGLLKDNFEEFSKDILQISTAQIGLSYDNFPIYLMECMNQNIPYDEINISYNPSCYQRQYKNGQFALFEYNDLIKLNKERYHVLKVHTKPIIYSKGILNEKKLYLCEIVVL